MHKSTLLFSKALADQTRQKIMRMICCQWLSVNEITTKLGLTQPTISHHLAILKEAGLVLTRQEGKFTYYTLDQEHVVSCCGRLMVDFAPRIELTTLIQNYFGFPTSNQEL
ncbi:MAG: hypothetical protein Kow0088_14570 [Anaerolineales bacterium]